jgi:hypothetical protein
MRQVALLILLASFSRSAIADVLDAERVHAAVSQATEKILARFACRIVIHGDPRFDGFSGTWLVAYSASGAADCDAAAAALQQEGEPRGVAFFRRPDRAQVEELISATRASVQAAYGCRISLVDEPRFDESSGTWSVDYLASGPGCDDAAEELGRRGNEQQIRFMRRAGRADLLR